MAVIVRKLFNPFLDPMSEILRAIPGDIFNNQFFANHLFRFHIPFYYIKTTDFPFTPTEDMFDISKLVSEIIVKYLVAELRGI